MAKEIDHTIKSKSESISIEIVDVIKSIQEMDRRIEKFVIERKDKYLTDIKMLKKGRKALEGYGGKSLGSPRFIDRKS